MFVWFSDYLIRIYFQARNVEGKILFLFCQESSSQKFPNWDYSGQGRENLPTTNSANKRDISVSMEMVPSLVQYDMRKCVRW
jgi:hypothetical protein